MADPTQSEKQETRTPVAGRGRGLLANGISNIVGQVVLIALAFFSTPYITRKLGTTEYGALSLLMTYLFAFSLLNLGINTSLVKYLAELLPKRDVPAMQAYLSTSLTLLGGIGFLAACVLFAGAEQIVNISFKGSGALTNSIVIAVRIASGAFLLQFASQVLSAVPIAAQRFDIVNIIRTGSEGLRIGGTIVLLFLGFRLPALMTISLVASFAACLAYALVVGRLVYGLKVRLGVSRTHVRSLFAHSRYVITANFSSQLVTSADNILIGSLMPVANVAYYSIAYTLAQRVGGIVGNALSMIFPAASACWMAEDRKQIQGLYLRGMKMGAAVAAFPIFALLVFSRPFLNLWLGPEYAAKSSGALQILAVAFLVYSLMSVPYQILQSTHAARTAAIGILRYALVNLLLFLLLIPRFGIVGASSAFLASQLICIPWFIHKANRLVGVSWNSVLRTSYGNVFLAASMAGLLCWVCMPWVHSFATLALAILLGAGVYAAVGYRIILDGAERQAIQIAIQRLRSRSRGNRHGLVPAPSTSE